MYQMKMLKKTLKRFVKLIKDNYHKVDNKFIEGIKKNFIYSGNKNNAEYIKFL